MPLTIEVEKRNNVSGLFGAQGESRTHTPVRAGDFETLKCKSSKNNNT